MHLSRPIQILGFAVLLSGCVRSSGEDFESFRVQFASDEAFRLSRIKLPLMVSIGSACEEDIRQATWSEVELNKWFDPPVTVTALASERLVEKIDAKSPDEIVVSQVSEEGDSYLLSYTFKQLDGRWWLVSYENASC